MCTLRENPGYAYEKKAPPYIGMGPLEWLIRPWTEAMSQL